jgi:adenylate cyclase class IV
MSELDTSEIEICFVYKHDMESKLRSIGAKFIEKIILNDTYYDFSDGSFFLTKHDFWLRYRVFNDSKIWQLKHPIAEFDTNNSIKKYYEIENESKICEDLKNLFSEKLKSIEFNYQTLDSLINELNIKKFSNIITQRLVFKFENFEIDLDETDFGYKVGEIEFKTESNYSIEEKVNQVSQFASKLGSFILYIIIEFKTLFSRSFK